MGFVSHLPFLVCLCGLCRLSSVGSLATGPAKSSQLENSSPLVTRNLEEMTTTLCARPPPLLQKKVASGSCLHLDWR